MQVNNISFLFTNSAFKPFVRYTPNQTQGLVKKADKVQVTSILSEGTGSFKNDNGSIKRQSSELDKKDTRIGRWTEREHKLFLEAMELHGNSWEKVEEHIGTRTRAQIRSHAQKYYTGLRIKAIKKYKENSDRNKVLFVVIREYLNTSTFK